MHEGKGGRWREPAPVSRVLDWIERLPLHVVAGGLFAVSLVLRLYYQNDGLFLYDSVSLAQAIEDTLKTGRLHGQINGRQGSVLFGLLAYLPDRMLTGEPSAERALLTANALWASAAVPALFFLGRSLLQSATAAFFGALLFSLSPIYLSVSTWAKPHGLEVFQIVTSFALLLSARSSSPLKRLALASFLIGSAIFCREATLLLLPLYVIAYVRPEIVRHRPFIRIDRRVWSLRWLAAGLLPLAVLLALSIEYYLGDVVLRTLTVKSSGTVTFNIWPTRAIWNALGDLATQLTPLGIVLSLGGAAALARRKDLFPFLFLAAWAALLYPIGNASAYWPRLLAVLSPPFFLCLGLGAAWIHERSRLATLFVVMLIGAQMLYVVVPLLSYRRDFSGEKVQALWLRDVLPSNSLVIAMDDSVFIEYYAGLETMVHPIDAPKKTKKWIVKLKERLSSGTPVYIINAGWRYDSSRSFHRAMLYHFDFEEIGSKEIEDYHRSSLRDRRYKTVLRRVLLRANRKMNLDDMRRKGGGQRRRR